MNLKDFASPLKAKNNFIKASFGGFAGGGKTRTASEFIIGAYEALGCSRPVLIIDNEKGSRFLIPLFKAAGIETLVKDTVKLPDVLKAFNFLNDGEIDFLFMDSLTKVWYDYVNDYKTRNRRTFMTLQDWGKILPSWQEKFADKFVQLNGNCVFTGRGGYTYDMEENEGKKQFVKSGVKMKMAGETPFEPDLNIWMDSNQKITDDKPEIWREALILKDRSNLIDGKTFVNPTYKDFAPVIDYLLAVPKGEVAGSSDESNLAPSENYEWENEKEERQIQSELIKDLFMKSGLGGTKEAVKKHKIKILEMFFGTSSATAMEKLSAHALKDGRIKLEAFMEGFLKAKNRDEYLENSNVN